MPYEPPDMRGVDIDMTYVISEIQDIQAELETHKLSEITSRLEGIEARLKELTDALFDYAVVAPHQPYGASLDLRHRLASE